MAALEYACELMARTLMAQFDYITRLWMFYNWDNVEARDGEIVAYRAFADPVEHGHFRGWANGLEPNATFGIASKDYADAGRVAFDLRDVIRHRLSWDDKPEGGWTVNFVKPMNWAMKDNQGAGVPLATIETCH